MKKTLLLISIVLLLLAACVGKMSSYAEYRSGLIEIAVYYQVPAEGAVSVPADCVVPILSPYYVSEENFDGYERGWRLVKYEECRGFAHLR